MKYRRSNPLFDIMPYMILFCAPTYLSAGPLPYMHDAKYVSQLLGETFVAEARKELGTYHRLAAHLSGPTGSATVDKETGILLAFDRNSSGHGEIGDIAVTAEEAYTKAIAFLAKVKVQPEEPWILTKNRYFSHGAGDREYTLEWSKFFHGVELPSLINVSVNADTGEIRHYFLIDDPVTISLNARLSAEDAVQVVAMKAGWVHPTVERVWPAVWYQPYYPGPQALLWRVHLTNSDARLEQDGYVQADVNATTGEIFNYAIPMSKRPVGSSPKGAPTAISVEKLPPLPTPDLQGARKGKIPATVFQRAKRNR